MPKTEKGKHTSVVTFGNAIPSNSPETAEARPASPTVENDTGEGMSETLSRTPIQKPPRAPTNAPRVRSLLDDGARHQPEKARTRRATNVVTRLPAPAGP
ncbi:hypothetical protein GCM10007918_16570 [Piscinibacter gummiphilus]|nr:hypothetical protein GCM10007918_16570 [Piscinibacter gummiphilus]